MNPAFDAFLISWPYDPWLYAGLLLSAAIYLRGWSRLKRHDPKRWHTGRPAAFLTGLFAILLALASPIETFANLLLQVHMLQHMLLLMVAPPLIWLSAPLLPMLRGLPAPIRKAWVVPILRSPLIQETFAWLVHPLVAWPIMVGVVWLWHTPRGYDLALDDPTWHVFEHLSFTAAALLFWYPVIAPFPSRPHCSRWLVLPYLILADVQNTILAAWLAFAREPIYAHYTEVPRIGGWSVLGDQQAAGVLMWVPGSITFLVPVVWIGLKMLYGRGDARPSPAPAIASLPALTVISSCETNCGTARSTGARLRSAPPMAGADLLHAPLLGRFLRWRHSRPLMQLGMLVLAALVILDGLTGPDLGPANLAGVAPWIHWRGLVVLGLLVGGNFFCMACPFTLPRTLAARWLPAGRTWPRALRNKWLAIVLLILFLWSYEAFSLWDSPWLTAWIAIAYFAGALVIDGVFRGSAFCKYVCPIGQFNFVQALVSPLEVRVREPAVCSTCRTHECIRGSETVSGCGMNLFQPHKVGNLDCTFCLDCVHACPHDNVGLLMTLGTRGLTNLGTLRSGIGRLSRRVDATVLVLVLVCGAFANAAGMIAPVVAWQDRMQAWLGNPPLIFIVSMYYFGALVLLPLALVTLAANLSRWWGRLTDQPWHISARFAYALVPLGFGMWLAHHGFHLFTSYAAIVPVAQRMALDFGLGTFGDPQWRHACCTGVADWIIRYELLALDVGLLASLLVGYRVAANEFGTSERPLSTFAPWAALMLLLFALGVWIVLEPMQMRGTLLLE